MAKRELDGQRILFDRRHRAAIAGGEKERFAMKRSLSALVPIALMPSWVVAQERIKFPVGVSSKVLGYGHLWAAWKLRYFERQGLDVEVILMRGTAPAVQALIAGSISAGLIANDGPIAAVEQGMDIVMIAASSKITH